MKNIINISKEVLKYITIFVSIIILFNALLYITSSFPSEWIEENVRESADMLLEEGNFCRILNMKNIRNDNYTDVIMINEAYSIDNNDILYSYMSGRKNYKDGLTKNSLTDANGNLLSFANNLHNESGEPVPDTKYNTVKELKMFIDGKVTTSINYSRYWHGYLVLLRPLLLLFNVTELRIFLAIVFLILFIQLIYLINKKINRMATIIFGFSFIGFGYFFVSYFLGGAPLFLVLTLSSIILMMNIEKYKPKNLYLHIFITACLANFVDFLTVPLLTLAIPLYLYLLYKRNLDSKRDIKQEIKIIITSGIFWVLGYALTWMSKWILFDVLFDGGGITSAIKQIMYRSYGKNDEMEYFISLFLRFFPTITIALLLLFITGLLIFSKDIKVNRNFKNGLKNELPILLISAMPLVWFCVLFNHTIYHTCFTHRNLMILVIGILICITDNIVIIESKNKSKK